MSQLKNWILSAISKCTLLFPSLYMLRVLLNVYPGLSLLSTCSFILKNSVTTQWKLKLIPWRSYGCSSTVYWFGMQGHTHHICGTFCKVGRLRQLGPWLGRKWIRWGWIRLRETWRSFGDMASVSTSLKSEWSVRILDEWFEVANA